MSRKTVVLRDSRSLKRSQSSNLSKKLTKTNLNDVVAAVEPSSTPPVDEEVLAIYQKVFSGRYDNIPAPISQQVRVFTSSTFTDTTVERNALMEEVYPALKEYCRENHGLDFQVVDMRWGVRDEATDDHMTTKLCINEIANCQRLSLGPNFVVFLCQKYGYRPLPSEILSSEFDTLKRMLVENQEDVSLLETWYIEDANSVPKQYVLQPISSILFNFNNKRIPKLQERDAKTWWQVEARMQNQLRKAAKCCYDKGFFTHEHMHNYFMSVTEREVINGILSSENPNEHCLCFVRHIDNIVVNPTTAAAKFIDLVADQINSEAQKLLANLRDERVPTKLHKSCIRRYAIEWLGKDGIDATYHASYISKFCLDFSTSVTALIDAAVVKQSKFRDHLYSEILRHLYGSHLVSSAFHGREKEIEIARQYMLSEKQIPMIFQGENGCGKTSLLARVSTQVRSWLGISKDPVVILRFIGTTADSSSISPLLTSVCDQIAWNYDMKLKDQSPTELSKLFHHFKRMIGLATAERPLDLALEVINKWLQKEGRTLTSRQWDIVSRTLNNCTLPLFVKLVFATVSRWKSYSKPQDTILSQSVHESIHVLLERTENQHGRLLVSHALSYITAARSGLSDSEVEDLISLDDRVLDDAYQYHLPPVRRIPPLLWSRIRAGLPGYLSEQSADSVIVLNWYHVQFRSVATERYFKNLNHLQSTHSAIADYFLGTWAGVPKPFQYTEVQKQRFGLVENEGFADRKVPKQPNIFHIKEGKQIRCNTRKLNELPYHLLRAKRTQELVELCLFNFDFLYAKISSFPLQSVIADFEDAMSFLGDPDLIRQLSLVADALRLSASILNKTTSMLAYELSGRLLPLAPSNAHIRRLLISCDIDGSAVNCFVPTHHSFHSPGGPLKYSLEEHLFAVFGMRVTSDSKLLVTVSNILIVWEIATGDLARIVDPNIDGVFFGLALSKNNKYAAAYSNNNQVVIISLITGDFVSIENETLTEQMQIVSAEFTSDGEVLFWSNDEIFFYSKDGKFLHSITDFSGGNKKLLHVFTTTNRHSMRFVTWSGENDDWTITLTGSEKSSVLKPFPCCGSIIFVNAELTIGYCGIESGTTVPENSDGIIEKRYSICRIELDGREFRITNTVVDQIEEIVNCMHVFYTSKKIPENHHWVVGVTVSVFVLYNREVGKVVRLHLPVGVRNTPIRPMHTSATMALARNESLFVVGLRKSLYIWEMDSQQLLQTVDAHFGRILNLAALNVSGHPTLITSSIDHCIKIWNLENIFEKSYSVPMLDQPIDKILIPKERPTIAVIHTRKFLAMWSLRDHRLLGILVANVHGAVVTHSLLASSGDVVVCIESDTLLVWQLRTQSVSLRINAPNVFQIVFLDEETKIGKGSIHMEISTILGVLFRQLDTPEQKICRFVVYDVADLSVTYSYEFQCRMFRECAVLRDTVTVVFVILFKGHDSLLVADITEGVVRHRFRPRQAKNKLKDVIVHRLIAHPTAAHHIMVMEGESKGSVWDVAQRRLIRSIQGFGGICSNDGKLGLHAPSKGGLHIIDLRTTNVLRTLIGNVTEGVHDVRASFTLDGKHVLYYHYGHRTLRAFRVSDGAPVGVLRPHAQLTCWACASDGSTLIIGCQDGSLLSAILCTDQKIVQEKVALMPSRRFLAEHLGIETSDEQGESFDLSKVGGVAKAVAKFKQSTSKKSYVCAIQ
uniref:WD_REPEATS_REGION domain-containing protein n=2 Tax=Steinernema glaseri TaxID=37863 RepID=A0A1I8AA47_9BILA